MMKFYKRSKHLSKFAQKYRFKKNNHCGLGCTPRNLLVFLQENVEDHCPQKDCTVLVGVALLHVGNGKARAHELMQR